MSLYLCRNGHIVRTSYMAGRECAKCRFNEKKRNRRVLTKMVRSLDYQIIRRGTDL